MNKLLGGKGSKIEREKQEGERRERRELEGITSIINHTTQKIEIKDANSRRRLAISRRM